MQNKLKISLGDLQLRFRLKGANVIVVFEDGNVLLESQSITAVADVLNRNFDTVYRRFEHAVMQGATVRDLQRMSVFIVLHYLCLFNKWRHLYPEMENLDLGFREEDFGHPGTYDIIANYCKQHFPGKWVEITGEMLRKSIEEIRRYETERQLYYNK